MVQKSGQEKPVGLVLVVEIYHLFHRGFQNIQRVVGLGINQ